MAKTKQGDMLDQIMNLTLGCRRLTLQTLPAQGSMAGLRKAWNQALSFHDAHAGLFYQQRAGVPTRIIFRPVHQKATVPTLEMVLLGTQALTDEVLFRKAWSTLELNGAGRLPNHQLIRILDWKSVDPWGNPTTDWQLEHIPLPKGHLPFRLRFSMPLSLETGPFESDQAPTWPIIASAAMRRLAELTESTLEPDVAEWVTTQATEAGASCWHPDNDTSFDSNLYSPEMMRRGIRGYIDFPNGAGPLTPIVTALPWIHVGRLIHIGMGRPILEPIPDQACVAT